MDEFHGKGYSTHALTGDEAAQVRHMYASVAQDWKSLRKIITIINAVVIIYDIIKVCGPVLITLAGIGFYLKSTGVL